MPRIRLLILIALTSIAVSAAANDPIRLDTGMISGVKGNSPDVRVYKGIPFAAPPVGDLRFRAPQPPAKWEGTRIADQFGPMCMQGGAGGGRGGGKGPGKGPAKGGDKSPAPAAPAGRGGQAMSEDCLYLNVWTPAKSSKERLPVLVYFYGGGFLAGDGSEARYEGESIARKGIVALTVNYRLGGVWLPRPSRVDEGVPVPCLRQLRPAGSERRLALGAAEHCRLWRRSKKSHHRRRVGRIDFRQRADGLTAVEGFDRRSNW